MLVGVNVVDNGCVVANDTAAALKARMGNTVIEIALQDEAAGLRAEEVLSRLVDGDRLEREGAMVRMTSGEAPGLLLRALRSLDDAALDPASLTVREPSLDDVFLTLTGQTVSEGDGGGSSGDGA